MGEEPKKPGPKPEYVKFRTLMVDGHDTYQEQDRQIGRMIFDGYEFVESVAISGNRMLLRFLKK